MLRFYYRGRAYRWLPERFIINLLIFLVVLIGGFSLINNLTQAAVAKEIVTITVGPGDTLWMIAKRLTPQADPRPVISQIIRQNHLTGSPLVAGQNLRLELAASE